MKIILKDNPLYIDFMHQTTGESRYTQCVITYNGIEYPGIATCAENDQFEKKTGRKISLTRALYNSVFTKEERADIWKQYFSQINSKIRNNEMV